MVSPSRLRAAAGSLLGAAKAAAARGARPDQAHKAANAKVPRQILLDTAVGLESVLERELDDLGIAGRREPYAGGIALEGPEASMWRAALESRVVDSVRLVVGRPFHAQFEATLTNHAAGVPWAQYMHFGTEAAAPPLKVSMEKSRLYHQKVVERSLVTAIEDHRQAYMKEKVQRTDDSQVYGGGQPLRPPLPKVHVELRKDECQLSIAATDRPLHRAYELAAPAEAEDAAAQRAPLGAAHAAACVLRIPLLRHLEELAEEGDDGAGGGLVVWDPFCGRGTMLLEALGIALGVPPASPAMRLPFAEFPSFDEERYADVVRALQVNPHPEIERLTLLGTDASQELVQAANANLGSFLRAMPRPRSGPLSRLWAGGRQGHADSEEAPFGVPALPCTVAFREAGSPAEVAPMVRGCPTVILTSVPYGGKENSRKQLHRMYEDFGAVVRDQAGEGGLKEVYCLAREDFRQSSGLDWRTELRFTSGGIKVDLLRWTGRVVRSPREAEGRPKRSPPRRRKSGGDGRRRKSAGDRSPEETLPVMSIGPAREVKEGG